MLVPTGPKSSFLPHRPPILGHQLESTAATSPQGSIDDVGYPIFHLEAEFASARREMAQRPVLEWVASCMAVPADTRPLFEEHSSSAGDLTAGERECYQTSEFPTELPTHRERYCHGRQDAKLQVSPGRWQTPLVRDTNGICDDTGGEMSRSTCPARAGTAGDDPARSWRATHSRSSLLPPPSLPHSIPLPLSPSRPVHFLRHLPRIHCRGTSLIRDRPPPWTTIGP